MSTPLTAEQLVEYRATARRHQEERLQRRQRRRELAWTVAHEAASLLRAEYGASRVIVFGSLVEDGGRFFGEHSDIDLAATSLTIGGHLQALGHLLRLSSAFEFDLVDLDRCREGLRTAVENEGVEL